MKQRYPLPVALAYIALNDCFGASPRGFEAAAPAGQCLATPAIYPSAMPGLLRGGPTSVRAAAMLPAQPGGLQPAFY